MKAKMPASQKPPEPGEYECIWCDTIVDYKSGSGQDLVCPNCGNKDRKDLVPVYIANLPEDDAMYTPADFPGG